MKSCAQAFSAGDARNQAQQVGNPRHSRLEDWKSALLSPGSVLIWKTGKESQCNPNSDCGTNQDADYAL
jgi:hypothetical protein